MVDQVGARTVRCVGCGALLLDLAAAFGASEADAEATLYRWAAAVWAAWSRHAPEVRARTDRLLSGA